MPPSELDELGYQEEGVEAAAVDYAGDRVGLPTDDAAEDSDDDLSTVGGPAYEDRVLDPGAICLVPKTGESKDFRCGREVSRCNRHRDKRAAANAPIKGVYRVVIEGGEIRDVMTAGFVPLEAASARKVKDEEEMQKLGRERTPLAGVSYPPVTAKRSNRTSGGLKLDLDSEASMGERADPGGDRKPSSLKTATLLQPAKDLFRRATGITPGRSGAAGKPGPPTGGDQSSMVERLRTELAAAQKEVVSLRRAKSQQVRQDNADRSDEIKKLSDLIDGYRASAARLRQEAVGNATAPPQAAGAGATAAWLVLAGHAPGVYTSEVAAMAQTEGYLEKGQPAGVVIPYHTEEAAIQAERRYLQGGDPTTGGLIDPSAGQGARPHRPAAVDEEQAMEQKLKAMSVDESKGEATYAFGYALVDEDEAILCFAPILLNLPNKRKFLAALPDVVAYPYAAAPAKEASTAEQFTEAMTGLIAVTTQMPLASVSAGMTGFNLRSRIALSRVKTPEDLMDLLSRVLEKAPDYLTVSMRGMASAFVLQGYTRQEAIMETLSSLLYRVTRSSFDGYQSYLTHLSGLASVTYDWEAVAEEIRDTVEDLEEIKTTAAGPLCTALRTYAYFRDGMARGWRSTRRIDSRVRVLEATVAQMRNPMLQDASGPPPSTGARKAWVAKDNIVAHECKECSMVHRYFDSKHILKDSECPYKSLPRENRLHVARMIHENPAAIIKGYEELKKRVGGKE